MDDRVRYSVTFAVLGLALGWTAIQAPPASWILAWPAASSIYVALCYARLGPAALGKRPDGVFAPWVLIPAGPYLALTWLVWRIGCAFTREPACDEVAPGLWVGRRVAARRLPAGTDLVVDLTAEMSEARDVLRGRTYRLLSTLDSTAPEFDALCRLVEEASRWEGVVFVHCAQGHGRSALFAAAVLIARGLADDAAGAETILLNARPGISLRPSQRSALAGYVSRRSIP